MSDKEQILIPTRHVLALCEYPVPAGYGSQDPEVACMDKKLLRQCEEAEEADKEKVFAIIAAMKRLHEDMYGESPEEE